MTRFLILLVAFLAMATFAKSQSQADTSDKHWSIVVPTPKSTDIDMLQCLVSSRKDSVVSNFVQNIGSWKFRVDSIYFRGTDAGAFTLVSGFPKYSIEPSNNHFAEFRFAPTEAKVYNAEIVIITQAETLIQTIRGQGVEQKLAILEKLIDFGIVDVGKFKDTLQTVTIKNIGSTAITIIDTKHNYPNDVDFSTLAGGGNFTINPNESKLMDLRFSPSDVGRTSGTLEFHYNGVGSPAIMQLFGEGIKKNPKIQSSITPFNNLICETESISTIDIRNEGGNDLIINSLNISGINNLDFIVNQSLPISIKPDSTYSLPITFRPLSSGNKVAELEIKSNADPDSMLTLQLSAKKDNSDFSLSTNSIDYGNLNINESSIKNLTIKNIGTMQTNYSLVITGNLQISETNFTLMPDAEKELIMTFSGSQVAINITGNLSIIESVCNQEKVFKIIGTVFSASASIKTTNLEAFAGDEIEVPIILSSSENLALAGVNSINAELIFNPTLLAPIGYPIENINNKTAKIKIEKIPISSNVGSNLTIIKFKVGLGNAESCDLTLDNVETIGGTADISLINGSFKLLGICEEGGTRLINPAKITKLMQISPNPSDGNVNVELNLVEKGNTTLKVFTVSSELIEEIVITNQSGNINIELDTKNYGNGLYFIHLQTPTVNKIEKLIIYR